MNFIGRIKEAIGGKERSGYYTSTSCLVSANLFVRGPDLL